MRPKGAHFTCRPAGCFLARIDEKRIRSQMNDEEKRKYADFVIVNDGETPLIPQVLELIGSLSEKMHYLLRK